MKIPDMNEKNTRAFLDKVRERASSYTPESVSYTHLKLPTIA